MPIMQQQQMTPEQQRIMELFKNNNPAANFAPIPNDPNLYKDARGGDPYQDYTQQQPLQTEQAQPNTGYQDALRTRLGQISGLGQQQTAAVFEARQRQQIAAQQSYGSGQTLGQNTQYQPGVAGARGKVLQAVAAMQGTPYSWGGGTDKGPSRGFAQGANTVGFDCSSLVKYAFAKIGWAMPRLAEQQQLLGQKTSINNLRPGDLVAGPHHIAVYAGNGMMWEAPSTGKTVRLTPVRSGMFGVALKY